MRYRCLVRLILQLSTLSRLVSWDVWSTTPFERCRRGWVRFYAPGPEILSQSSHKEETSNVLKCRFVVSTSLFMIETTRGLSMLRFIFVYANDLQRNGFIIATGLTPCMKFEKDLIDGLKIRPIISRLVSC